MPPPSFVCWSGLNSRKLGYFLVKVCSFKILCLHVQKFMAVKCVYTWCREVFYEWRNCKGLGVTNTLGVTHNCHNSTDAKGHHVCISKTPVALAKHFWRPGNRCNSSIRKFATVVMYTFDFQTQDSSHKAKLLARINGIGWIGSLKKTQALETSIIGKTLDLKMENLVRSKTVGNIFLKSTFFPPFVRMGEGSSCC